MEDEKETGYDFCKNCIDYSEPISDLSLPECNNPFGMIGCNTSIKRQKLEICQKYCDLIQYLEQCYGKGFEFMAGKDSERVCLHKELCEIFGITHEQCLGITDELDKINYNPSKLKSILDNLECGYD